MERREKLMIFVVVVVLCDEILTRIIEGRVVKKKEVSSKAGDLSNLRLLQGLPVSP